METREEPTCPNKCLHGLCESYKGPIDSTKKPIIWVLGGPGCGKGTQCEKIIDKYGFTHISTGDLLRAEMKKGNDRGKQVLDFVEKGELVPNELMLEVLRHAMHDIVEDTRGFLIDGFPREKSQGVAFERTVAPVTAILYFEAADETLMRRCLDRALTSDRADDNMDAIKVRLKTFHEHNPLVLKHYAEKVFTVNAEDSPDDIFSDVQRVLDPLVNHLPPHVHTLE